VSGEQTLAPLQAGSAGPGPRVRGSVGGPIELTRTGPFDTVASTDVRHLSLYLPGMTAPGVS